MSLPGDGPTGIGTGGPWAPLDSFFNHPRREAAQMHAVRQQVSERPGAGNLIPVTHQVNIAALTGLALPRGK